jgi:hypothetical protein
MAAPAAAQSTFVSAAIVGDIARFDRAEIAPSPDFFGGDPGIDGETVGFNVSLGRSIGERWGVALEAGRSGEIANRGTQRFSPLRGTLTPVTPAPTTPSIGLPSILPPFPDFEFAIETELQHTSVSALAWVSHEAGDRVDLTYFGGVSFIRTESETSMKITDPRLIQFLPFPNEITTFAHDTGPVIGAEAAIKFGDHVAVTAGARLHATSAAGRNGWLIRPGLGARWTF